MWRNYHKTKWLHGDIHGNFIATALWANLWYCPNIHHTLGFKTWRHKYLTNQTSRCEFWSEYGRHGRELKMELSMKHISKIDSFENVQALVKQDLRELGIKVPKGKKLKRQGCLKNQVCRPMYFPLFDIIINGRIMLLKEVICIFY